MHKKVHPFFQCAPLLQYYHQIEKRALNLISFPYFVAPEDTFIQMQILTLEALTCHAGAFLKGTATKSIFQEEIKY